MQSNIGLEEYSTCPKADSGSGSSVLADHKQAHQSDPLVIFCTMDEKVAISGTIRNFEKLLRTKILSIDQLLIILSKKGPLL